ncbi:MAG: DUF3817 domain-containing protein [Flavobacteriaceae bacterium]|nr:DUF3817 domain-containing protein [Flavobacteriaceae bacterium]
MKTVFRIVSFLEGTSLILLLLAAIYKRTQGDETFVKLLGMPHGILFIMYLILAFLIKSEMKWNNKTLAIVMVASLIPFGTYYIDRKYLN